MRIIKDWIIITVPRVGSHYLQERIFVHTNKALVLKYHEPVLQTWGYANPGLLDNSRFWSGLDANNLKVITIVRDPKDLLISDVAMGLYHHFTRNGLSESKFKDTFLYEFDQNIEENLKNRVDKYSNDYSKLESLSSIIIDYNDLVSFPFEVTCFVANRIGIEIMTDEYKPVGLDKNKFLVSSKNIPEYDIAKDILKDLDLSKFYEAYDKIKSKCIYL